MSNFRERECPMCGGPALRIRRRLIDRLVSLVIPVHRYQCQMATCGWHGNLRVGERSFTHHPSPK